MEINKELFERDVGASPRHLLPKYLPVIRACLGWTSAELADRIGVSRTTISAFEKAGKENQEIDLMPYLAIRKVLDDEISDNPDETEVLAAVIGALVDQLDNPSIEEKMEICRKVAIMSKAIRKSPDDRKATSKAWSAFLIAGGVIVTGAIIALLKGKKP